MSVNSLGNSNSQDKTYVLLPKSASLEGLEFNEYALYFHHILKNKGFVKSTTGINGADIVVTADFDLRPQVTVTNAYIPTFGKTGISSSHTTGSINSGNISMSTTYSPSYGVNGYAPAQFKRINYSGFLRLSAFSVKDWKQGKKADKNELWTTYSHSWGSSPDLRVVMPYLVISISEHVGKNTERMINTELDADDERIQSLINSL